MSIPTDLACKMQRSGVGRNNALIPITLLDLTVEVWITETPNGGAEVHSKAGRLLTYDAEDIDGIRMDAIRILNQQIDTAAEAAKLHLDILGHAIRFLSTSSLAHLTADFPSSRHSLPLDVPDVVSRSIADMENSIHAMVHIDAGWANWTHGRRPIVHIRPEIIHAAILKCDGPIEAILGETDGVHWKAAPVAERKEGEWRHVEFDVGPEGDR